MHMSNCGQSCVDVLCVNDVWQLLKTWLSRGYWHKNTMKEVIEKKFKNHRSNCFLLHV